MFTRWLVALQCLWADCVSSAACDLQLIGYIFVSFSNCGGGLEPSGDTVSSSSWPTSPAVCHKINWSPFFSASYVFESELDGMVLSILRAFRCFRPWCQHILLQLFIAVTWTCCTESIGFFLLWSLTVDENLDKIFCRQPEFFRVTLCVRIGAVYLHSLNLLHCY